MTAAATEGQPLATPILARWATAAWQRAGLSSRHAYTVHSTQYTVHSTQYTHDHIILLPICDLQRAGGLVPAAGQGERLEDAGQEEGDAARPGQPGQQPRHQLQNLYTVEIFFDTWRYFMTASLACPYFTHVKAGKLWIIKSYSTINLRGRGQVT